MLRPWLVLALVACTPAGDTDRVARLEERAAAAEAQLADLHGHLRQAGLTADDSARWWCNAGKCSRFEESCKSAGAGCVRQRVAFCIRIATCFASLSECFGVASLEGAPPAACAGVE